MDRKDKKSLSEVLGLKEQKLTVKELIVPIGVVVVIIVSAIIFILPVFGKISAFKGEIESNKRLLGILEKKYKQLSDLKSETSSVSLQEDYEHLNMFVPNVKPSMQTLLHISKLAKMDGVEFSGLTLNPGNVKNDNKKSSKNKKVNKDELLNFEVDFSIKGEKDRILKFISDIKEVSPLMKIDHFSTSIDRGQLDGSQLFMNSSLKVLVYYQPQPESLPKLDKPLKMITADENQFLQSLKSYLFLDPKFIAMDKDEISSPLSKDNPFEIATNSIY